MRQAAEFAQTNSLATTNHYDLIVLGSDIAGLVTAVLTAQRGKRVLVVPIGPINGQYSVNQTNFPTDAAPLIHLQSPLLKRAYEELGLWSHLRREIRPASDSVHWILGRNRLDFDAGFGNARSELEREWPSERAYSAWSARETVCDETNAALDELFASDAVLAKDQFWTRRFRDKTGAALTPAQLSNPLALLPDGNPLRQHARTIEPWLQSLAPGQLGKAASMRLCGLWNAGPFDRNGGIASLRQQLLQRIGIKSGDVKPSLRVGEIILKRGKVVGISLLGKQDRYGCDHMLLAADPQRLTTDTLLPDHLPKPLAQTLGTIERVAYRYTLNLVIREHGIGPALDGIAISAPHRPVVDGHGVGAMYLRVGKSSPTSTRVVTVTRIVSPEEDITEMRGKVIDDLDHAGVLPFARQHIEVVHSPHDGREVTDGMGKPLGYVQADSAMRHPMQPIVRSTTGSAHMGVALLPQSSGIRNLYLASALSFPGLGLEGEFLAGLSTANLITSPKRGGLGRILSLRRL